MAELKPGAAILLVDDDQVFCQVLARALKRRGYQPHVAHDIGNALGQAELRQHDFAVIDLKIERESGLDLIEPLISANPGIHIVILTGYSSIATAVAAIKLGALDYACKPVDADEVLALLAGKKQSEPGSDAVIGQPPSIKRLQWEYVQKVLEENSGNISATARSLGMHRRTLQRMLQKKPVRR